MAREAVAVWHAGRALVCDMNVEAVGKRLTDLELLAEIARLRRSVASFGAAVLLAAYRAEAERRGFKEV